MITATCYTPVGLTFDPREHRYTFNGCALLNVTGVLAAAGLVDRAWFTPDDRERGTRVHAAIERYHTRPLGYYLTQAADGDDDAITAPYLRAYRRFLAESAFRVDACEERLADRPLLVAGTLDLRGEFVPGAPLDARAIGDLDLQRRAERVDVLDVKSGTTPPWVGYQLAGYVRLLPPEVRPRCRRWSLTLRHDGSYRLQQCANPTDAAVFAAAVVIAQSKRGWL